MADETSAQEGDDFTWQVTNREGKVTVALGTALSELPTDPIMHRLGETLIKLGTKLLQSTVSDDDDYDDD